MYTTKAKIQNYLVITIGDSFNSQISDWITAVESYINNYTGKKDGFGVSTSEVRYFDGNGKREIDVDDFISLSSVQILDVNSDTVGWTLTEGLESDYIVHPYNETTKYRLKLVASSTIGAWYSGVKRIKLTGIWGVSSTVPKDIELAATQLVATIVQKGMSGGEIQSESLGDYSVTFANLDKEAKVMGITQILNRYKEFKL